MDNFMQFWQDINSSTDTVFILIRTLVTFLIAVFVIRINPRIHLETAFDYVLVIMLGQIFERGIFNDSATWIQSLSVALLIIFIYKGISHVTYTSKFWGKILKGKCEIIYENGRFDRKKMEILQITEEDVMAMCREQLKANSLEGVAKINLERTGIFTFIKKK